MNVPLENCQNVTGDKMGTGTGTYALIILYLSQDAAAPWNTALDL